MSSCAWSEPIANWKGSTGCDLRHSACAIIEHETDRAPRQRAQRLYWSYLVRLLVSGRLVHSRTRRRSGRLYASKLDSSGALRHLCLLANRPDYFRQHGVRAGYAKAPGLPCPSRNTVCRRSAPSPGYGHGNGPCTGRRRCRAHAQPGNGRLTHGPPGPFFRFDLHVVQSSAGIRPPQPSGKTLIAAPFAGDPDFPSADRPYGSPSPVRDSCTGRRAAKSGTLYSFRSVALGGHRECHVRWSGSRCAGHSVLLDARRGNLRPVSVRTQSSLRRSRRTVYSIRSRGPAVPFLERTLLSIPFPPGSRPPRRYRRKRATVTGTNAAFPDGLCDGIFIRNHGLATIDIGPRSGAPRHAGTEFPGGGRRL